MKLVLGSPHQTYRNKAGEKVPGVTTVCGVLAKPFLLPWYASMEYEGIMAAMGEGRWNRTELDAVLPRNKEGKRSWYAVQKRDKSADLGTVAHARIHARLIGDELERDGLGSLWDQATPAVERFFKNTAGMTLVAAEHQMVSEKWQAGGTGDGFFITPSGTMQYRDIKTGKPWYDGKPYHEQIAQCAAYAAMYEEITGMRVDEIVIDRVGNTEGDKGSVYELTWKERNQGVMLFEAALAAFKAKRLLDGWSE